MIQLEERKQPNPLLTLPRHLVYGVQRILIPFLAAWAAMDDHG